MKMLFHMRSSSVVAICLALVGSTICHKILLEGRYTGQVYKPKGLRESYSPEPSYGRSYKSDINHELGQAEENKEESRNFNSFSDLINQLSSVIHNQLVNDWSSQGSSHSKNQARNLAKNEKPKDDEDDLYYHYYPHNQHLFNLPECATQQVCNAVYKRLNFTQPLCACPPLSDPCSASYLSNDQHTIELKMGGPNTKAVTLIKTCETTWSVRDCRAPRDWSILALQNTRTGKAHYLVICKCPDSSKLEGPLNHDQPTYAQVPGIRVYGMMCVRSPLRRFTRNVPDQLEDFPWRKVSEAFENKDLIEDLLLEDSKQTTSLQ